MGCEGKVKEKIAEGKRGGTEVEEGDNASEMSPEFNAESYPAFALIGLRKNLVPQPGDNGGETSPGSSTESYPAFARIGLRENPGKNLNQVTCPDQDSNPGHLVSRPDALTVTAQVLYVFDCFVTTLRNNRKSKNGVSTATLANGGVLCGDEIRDFNTTNYRRVYGGVAHDAKSIRLRFNKLLTTGSVLKQSGGARRSVTEEKVEEIRAGFQKSSLYKITKEEIKKKNHK
ncbi:hypothetical protein ANN_04915 [Periplaneta americana]|uniref:Uncharacterized protein n=1 Tax=Periplaneta americana TaxID=6978 RepID=A0ABQ8T9M2_PERAM|nr:hypothetical protein ANN_04915 [Periplaneta americana]